MLDVHKIRKDFDILNNQNNPIIYFDNACMSLKPKQVISAVSDYYVNYPACAGRSSHELGDKVTSKIKEVRDLVAKFINAKKSEEIIFTRNTTESINLIVNSFKFKKGDIILISDKEHNSNLIPWLCLRDRIGVIIKILKSNKDGTFDIDNFKKEIIGARFVSLVHTSNLDGVTIPAKEIIEIAHRHNSLVFLDCAQSIPHKKIDVSELDVDFIAFSGHKMYGPTGTGVLYGKSKLIEDLDSFIVGGETVSNSTYDSYEFLPAPEKFEAGLQDYAGIIGLGEAIHYLNSLNYKDIEDYEYELNYYITSELEKIQQIKIIGPSDAKYRSGIVNFYIENMNMQQMAVMLNDMSHIAVRAGRHCVHAWFNDKNIMNSIRLSFSFYNTKEEAEIFIKSLNKIMKII